MQPGCTKMLALKRLRDAPVIAMPSVPSTRAPRPPAFQNNMDVGIGAYYYENVFTQAELATWVTDESTLAWERFEGADSGRWQANLGDAFAEDRVRQLVERQVTSSHAALCPTSFHATQGSPSSQETQTHLQLNILCILTCATWNSSANRRHDGVHLFFYV